MTIKKVKAGYRLVSKKGKNPGRTKARQAPRSANAKLNFSRERRMMETAVAANTLCLKVRLLPRGLQMPAQSTATRTPCDFGRRYAASGISCLRQVFSNPKLLAKREPVQVCKMGTGVVCRSPCRAGQIGSRPAAL